MTDLNENAPFDEVTGVSNTDTQEHSDIETVSESDAEIDAINEALAEAEDLENTCETLGENLESDEVAQSCNEVAAELQDEPVSNSDRSETETGTVAENETVEESDELVGNSEQLEPEIPEPEPYICPWADAPEGTIYYEKIYEDGHLGSFTESAEMAYKFGWFNNRVSKDNVEQSEINGWTYLKDRCPHRTQEEIQQEAINQRITEIQIAVQNLLDSKAKEKLYDDAFAICSYANSTDETFHTEANQFIAWRDHCWRKCYEILALFQNRDIPMPTVGEVLRQLPVLEWE